MNKQLMRYIQELQTDHSFKMKNTGKADRDVVTFIKQCCATDDRLAIMSVYLYAEYKKYCDENNIKPLSSWRFKREIEYLGFTYVPKKRIGNKVSTAYLNISVSRY